MHGSGPLIDDALSMEPVTWVPDTETPRTRERLGRWWLGGCAAPEISRRLITRAWRGYLSR